jgi:hypothetical protein
MIIDRPTYRDVHYTVAYFTGSTSDPQDRRDPRYNFRPTLVKLGDYLVISSTEALARDLIDALKPQTTAAAAPLHGVHSLVELDSSQLIALADANRKTLIRKNMAKDGISEADAAARYDLATTLIKQLGQATLKIGTQDGQVQAGLEFKLNLH